MVTAVPPRVEPVLGEMEVTVGACCPGGGDGDGPVGESPPHAARVSNRTTGSVRAGRELGRTVIVAHPFCYTSTSTTKIRPGVAF
jgi:hypothetical protein